MDPIRWQQVKRLVEEVLQLPEEERGGLVAAVSDPELRQAAEALLSVSETRAEIFEHLRLLPERNDFPFKEGDQVGRYLIEVQASRGGMGTVYRARDQRNGRRAALKVLPPHLLPYSPNEDKALARLSHPNIATFYESDVTKEGFRYVAMEYVEGAPITTYCIEHCPTVRSRLGLFRKVCEAVEYAHRHLVVHRDLKPDNILVTTGGEPKLLDFGIAKILPGAFELATLTRLPERAVTVAFASPEQLSGDATTTATDVYSLGVLLCFLLTGQLPYKVENPHDLAWAIRKQEPERPSSLVSQLSEGASGDLPERDPKQLRHRLEGDLDAILLKALRKEPELRYRSVAELSEDLRRFLDHEPVEARHGTWRYRAGKFVERHRIGVASGVATLLALLAFTVALLVLRWDALQERDVARREAARAESVSDFLVDMFKVSNAWTPLGTPITAREVLDNAARRLETSPPSEASARGTLFRSLAKINLNLGAYTPADALLEPALADIRATQNDNRPLIAETLADLSEIRYHRARYAEAERYALQALSLNGSRDARSAMDIWTLLGRIAFARGDYTQAERLFRQSLVSAEALNGSLSPRASSAAHDLACALHAEGRYAEADSLYHRSLKIRRRLFGEGHHATLQVLQNLACLAADRGDLVQAEENFWAVRLGYRVLSDLDYPAIPTLSQNTGSTFLSDGKPGRAEPLLFDALAGYRELLPDEHPNIGRVLAELGRLFATQGREDLAERYYHDGLQRLERSLGKDHSDTLAVANNLAALQARRGKKLEAKAAWEDILRRAEARGISSGLLLLVRENLARLSGSKAGAAPESYATAGIRILDLTDTQDFLETPWQPPSRSQASSQLAFRFVDDFNDGVIDPVKWETRGKTVREENGQLRVLATVTDDDGQARTIPFSILPTRPLMISRRVKVHAGNDFSDGKMVVGIVGYPEKNFGVSYANYHYTGGGECVTVGISLFRRNANAHRFAERRINASLLIPPLWDRWFDEELQYDPRTGEVRYSIDGTERLSYNVGPLPPNASLMTLTFFPWGWYTGHSQDIDWVRVEQR